MRGIAIVCFLIGCGGSGSDAPACGDGVVDDGEACDDGNAASGDGCSATCATEVCGNGVVDIGEACDDGNTVDGDACSADCSVDNPAALTVNWKFQDIATNTDTDCPAGFDTVAVVSQAASSAPIIDLFNCADKTGQIVDLPSDLVTVHVEVENTNATMTYAKSPTEDIDLTNADKTVSFTIFNDGGYFAFAWMLQGATSNNALTCADVTDLTGIEITSTVSGGTDAFADQFNCVKGAGITAGLLAGSYTISIAAINAQDQALGAPHDEANKVIAAPNGVTDLGTITLPIDGL